MTPILDPQRDLTISRVIKAPRALVWRAWTDRARFERWFLPAPSLLRVVAMEVRPGGSLKTEMSEDGGAFVPHLDGCFLAVDEGSRIVFTNALTGGWRPAAEPFMTAAVTFEDHPSGTFYAAHVMHKDSDTRAMHETLGFYEGWGTVAGQLAAIAEREAAET